MKLAELIVFIVYLAGMLTVGVIFFIKSKGENEKGYFLGGRKMNGFVAALSAGASDMSSWVLMGLPGALFLSGLISAWIAVGLALGQALSWILISQRLRRLSIAFNDSITIPQFLTNRFKSSHKSLQVVCATIFILAYAIYAASSIKACGTLFNTVLGFDPTVCMIIAAVIIVGYTFLGGYNAVCWTDFFQGMLMLVALLATPIIALFAISGGEGAQNVVFSANYLSVTGGASGWEAISQILSGLAWGLGYFGMPHIIIRYMSIKSAKDGRRSKVVGITWTTLILAFSVLAGIIGLKYAGDVSALPGENAELIFIHLVRSLFPGIISGILLSAILAAAMSTADSQLLASASALSCDVYQPLIRKGKASSKEMLWVSRITVLAISVAALLIALLDEKGSIMSLVSNAWGIFGAAFGPAILLSLFWKRFNFAGATAGIITGAVVDLVWLNFLTGVTGLYELLPAFIASALVSVIVTLCTKEPSTDVVNTYQSAIKNKAL